VGISMIAHRAYKDDQADFVDRLYSMSLNEPLGMEIPGEGIPQIHHPKDKANWNGLSLPWMSIGYSLLITPLQTLAFYNAVANNGVMVKPMLVKEVRQAGRIIKTFETQVLNKRICSQSTIDSARSLLEGVVERGTATSLINDYYKIAGKTGTAQIANESQGYNKRSYNASFAGYFPADNPKYSCIVVVNAPTQGLYYGGSVAAPVFKEIADKVYATHLDIYQEVKKDQVAETKPRMSYGSHSDLQWLCEELDIPVSAESEISEWVVNFREDEGVRFAPRIIRDDQVPNVIGMNVRDAVYILEKLGMKAKVSGQGKVSSQSISPGTIVSKGKQIELKLSERG
ncbi:MAG TPA: penicillin-binding transpeptidase domain-containing protein, partial [Bacteroidales bacterium]|nr:penicillin-binding transpeptidase domain-containing protein [Bacteroidales bacterium]